MDLTSTGGPYFVNNSHLTFVNQTGVKGSVNIRSVPAAMSYEYNHSQLAKLFLKTCKYQLSWKPIPDLYPQIALLFHPIHILTT